MYLLMKIRFLMVLCNIFAQISFKNGDSTDPLTFNFIKNDNCQFSKVAFNISNDNRKKELL